jgi:xanthosine utilization system XapX-like protein
MLANFDYPDTQMRLQFGALTGFIAYIAQIVFLFLYHGINGPGWFFAPNLFATWLGNPLQISFSGSTLAGMVFHIFLSVMIGLIYGLIFIRTPSKPIALFVGLVAGFILYGISTSLIGPSINPIYSQHASNGIWLISFLIFGATHALYPDVVNRTPLNRRHKHEASHRTY